MGDYYDIQASIYNQFKNDRIYIRYHETHWLYLK